jgi:GNAT superfamily N-acetyltransferase
MTYRLLEPAELPELLPLAREFHQNEVLASWCSFDEDVWLSTWWALLEGGCAFILISEEDGEITGAIGGLQYPDMNDGVRVCQEAFWFVPKAKRGGGPALLREYERVAVEHGAERTVMNHLADDRAEHIARFYKRVGYQPLESSYYKELA